MHARLATNDDLPQIKTMFKAVVKNMDEQGIQIWNDVYPSESFAEDIACERLYVLVESAPTSFKSGPDTLLAVFALCGEPDNAHCVTWKDRDAEALYLYRLGVSVEHARKGIGQQALREAEACAKELGAHYLRLFVVDENVPAIKLYEKCGYNKVEGIRDEPLGDVVLKEYGFERKLTA